MSQTEVAATTGPGSEAAPGALARGADLAFRILFSLIFIVAGAGHFAQHEAMLDRLRQSPWFELVSALGSPSAMLYASGATLLVGGLALLLGYRTRLAALVLLATLVPITVSVHLAPGHVGPLFKNIALMGGLLHFAAHGSGAPSPGARRPRAR